MQKYSVDLIMSAVAIEEPLSRKGYALKDLSRSFVQTIGETGPEASGKLLHYTADFICSGGFELWQRLCWDYAFEHIGIASPRIFTYLRQKMTGLCEMAVKVSTNAFINSAQVQSSTAEIVLILQTCPKKAKVKLPIVPHSTHRNEEWLLGAANSTERAVVRKVWNHSVDLPPLLYSANELFTAITDGALEKALFWTRWIFEEDALLRKQYGSGLTTMDRGPATLGAKVRSHPGFFICSVLAEAYKELAEKSHIRMHEEFQTLLDIYRSAEKGTTSKRRQDALILMIQIITDVPRWRVPAAPSLIKDPVVLARAVRNSEIFFAEILRLPLPLKPLPNRVGSLAVKKKAPADKNALIQGHLDDAEKAILQFYGSF
jgi:hypothetical protein